MLAASELGGGWGFLDGRTFTCKKVELSGSDARMCLHQEAFWRKEKHI
jgi:hypothetical protein